MNTVFKRTNRRKFLGALAAATIPLWLDKRSDLLAIPTKLPHPRNACQEVNSIFLKELSRIEPVSIRRSRKNKNSYFGKNSR